MKIKVSTLANISIIINITTQVTIVINASIEIKNLTRGDYLQFTVYYLKLKLGFVCSAAIQILIVMGCNSITLDNQSQIP